MLNIKKTCVPQILNVEQDIETFNLSSTNLENVENENNLLLPGCEPTVSTNTDNNLVSKY